MSTKNITRLYVIDDDRHFIYGLNKGLKIRNYCDEILFFDDPKDALEVIEENIAKNESIPDFLFLDINMPGIDGWDFLSRLKPIQEKCSKKIKVFIVSSSLLGSDMEKALAFAEVENYLTKPLSKEMMETIFGTD